jgi:hypothetical protein
MHATHVVFVLAGIVMWSNFKLASETKGREWGQVRQRARSRGSFGEGSGPSPRGRNAKPEMGTGGSVPGQLWGGVGARPPGQICEDGD